MVVMVVMVVVVVVVVISDLLVFAVVVIVIINSSRSHSAFTASVAREAAWTRQISGEANKINKVAMTAAIDAICLLQSKQMHENTGTAHYLFPFPFRTVRATLES